MTLTSALLDVITTFRLKENEANAMGYSEDAERWRLRLEQHLREHGYLGDVRRSATIAWETHAHNFK